MGIGFRELIVLLFLFVVPCIAIGGVVWLESLLRAGQISTDEYDKQRASIISRI